MNYKLLFWIFLLAGCLLFWRGVYGIIKWFMAH